jgi:hypothetical protein
LTPSLHLNSVKIPDYHLGNSVSVTFYESGADTPNSLDMSIDRIAPASRRSLSRRTGDRDVSARLSHTWVIWLVLIAMFSPATMTVSVGGLSFPPGRIPVLLLFLPALYALTRDISRGQRQLLATDILMVLASAWMLLGSLVLVSTSTISTGSEILDLFGSYILARAYIFGSPAVETFIRALKFVVIAVVACALAETLSGRYLISNVLDPMQTGLRLGLVRASSTLIHPILYGTFCSISMAVFLYSEHTRLRRALYAGIALFGTFLSLSSAPLMSAVLMLFFYFYDCIASRLRWRWRLLWTIIFVNVGVIFVVSNAPIAWIISHLIFDSENGYYRLGSWYAALDQMALSPVFGFGFQATNTEYLDHTVDAVWLVIGLRYGIPTIAIVLLANIFAFWRINANAKPAAHLGRTQSGFTAALAMFIFIGLTVDFYDSMWMFWGLCIGIRASLQENNLLTTERNGNSVSRTRNLVLR